MDDVRVAGPGDADAVAEILADGFRDDPVMRWVFGGDVDRVLRPFFLFMVEEAHLPLGATYLSDACCAVWTPAGQEPWSAAGLGDRFLAAMAELLDQQQLERLSALDEVSKKVHPEGQHWYLGMIATRRAAQGMGAG